MKILVIDDSESIRQVLMMLLEMHGHQVTSANSGAEGVSIFKSNGGFDLVVTDHDMPPGMNGEQVITEIRKTKPRQPVVLFTANEELILKLKKTPCSFVLLRKPASMETILATVAAAVNN
ncbi:hypothetical protein AUJ42_00460 [Candidatus Collierbacteria bacterium CG1_02_44_10]|uniref:Response regulatory domain-containing protein n=1 Tax=Candidatus Collierbacteria bacterium CG1_02_44_10 TaxID=1805087 RepID=A0A1J4S2F3_9BACT|nr:MAG: hypothetical protein AUJ42_00460 [Candidatus Collierbacteria bacterium CG1_02_44_10]